MFVEKKRIGVSPRPLTANGGSDGTVTVSNIKDFFVKQTIILTSNSLQPRELEIKRFIDKNSFKVGPKGQTIRTYSDVSDFLVSDNAFISAPEQDRPGIKPDEIRRAVYAEEPVVAERSILVDEYGDYYGQDNPLPTSATFTGDINVKLTDEPIKISGTENGQPNGAEFPFVNNILQQILKAKDRIGTITYADFGTKNQRITQITYTAASIGVGVGFTAVKTFTYTLVGNKYRRETPGDWSLV